MPPSNPASSSRDGEPPSSPVRTSRLGLIAGLLAMATVACAPTPSGPPSQSSPDVDSSPARIDVSCTPDTESPAYLGDPCPAATLAVQLAVAPVRLPLTRIVIEPGPFFCDNVWPGAGSPVPCYGPNVQPGQFMHAWVSFAQSPEVAAVMLGRDLPPEIGSPAPTPPPWDATLVKVEVPPAAWRMP
jgi:hypothetical protein